MSSSLSVAIAVTLDLTAGRDRGSIPRVFMPALQSAEGKGAPEPLRIRKHPTAPCGRRVASRKPGQHGSHLHTSPRTGRWRRRCVGSAVLLTKAETGLRPGC